MATKLETELVCLLVPSLESLFILPKTHLEYVWMSARLAPGVTQLQDNALRFQLPVRLNGLTTPLIYAWLLAPPLLILSVTLLQSSAFLFAQTLTLLTIQLVYVYRLVLLTSKNMAILAIITQGYASRFVLLKMARLRMLILRQQIDFVSRLAHKLHLRVLLILQLSDVCLSALPFLLFLARHLLLLVSAPVQSILMRILPPVFVYPHVQQVISNIRIPIYVYKHVLLMALYLFMVTLAQDFVSQPAQTAIIAMIRFLFACLVAKLTHFWHTIWHVSSFVPLDFMQIQQESVLLHVQLAPTVRIQQLPVFPHVWPDMPTAIYVWQSARMANMARIMSVCLHVRWQVTSLLT